MVGQVPHFPLFPTLPFLLVDSYINDRAATEVPKVPKSHLTNPPKTPLPLKPSATKPLPDKLYSTALTETTTHSTPIQALVRKWVSKAQFYTVYVRTTLQQCNYYVHLARAILAISNLLSVDLVRPFCRVMNWRRWCGRLGNLWMVQRRLFLRPGLLVGRLFWEMEGRLLRRVRGGRQSCKVSPLNAMVWFKLHILFDLSNRNPELLHSFLQLHSCQMSTPWDFFTAEAKKGRRTFGNPPNFFFHLTPSHPINHHPYFFKQNSESTNGSIEAVCSTV